MLLSNDGHTTRMLQTLKECGFALALDDFGTGYSSLAYIRDFPFDRLKIDRSFVHGLKNSERALAIIEAVANFGRILGKDVVAEGIETEAEMQAMQRAGCTHLQGYLFAKAMPAEKIEAMVALGRLARDPQRRRRRPATTRSPSGRSPGAAAAGGRGRLKRDLTSDPPDRLLDPRDDSPNRRKVMRLCARAPAGLEGDPLLDRGALGAAVAQVEDVAGERRR